MRTRIDLAEDTRQALQTLAKERGLRSPARLVDEAVRFYLAERNKTPVVVEPAALPQPAPSVGGTALQAGASEGMGMFAMFAFPFWGAPFALFGFVFWSDLMRRFLQQRA
jgi:hypothetical protein